MVKIKYIEDTENNKIFPVTHERAVRDSNGATLESKLQIQTELINQNQMAIGAVPSDNEPLKNSAHWVTSGGVYNETYIETDVSSLLTTGWTAHGDSSLYSFTASTEDGLNGVFHFEDNGGSENRTSLDVSRLTNGCYYRLHFNLSSTSGYPPIGATAAYNSTWVTLTDINGNGVGSVSEIDAIFEKTSSFSVLLIPSNSSAYTYPIDITMTNFSLSRVESVKGKVADVDDVPTKNSEKFVMSGGVFPTKQYADFLVGDAVENSIRLEMCTVVNQYINKTNNRWQYGNTKSIFIPVSPKRFYKLTAHSTMNTRYAFLTTDQWTTNQTPSYAEGESLKEVAANTTAELFPPNDAKYINITVILSGDSTMPQSFIEVCSLNYLDEKIKDIDPSTIVYELEQAKIIDARTDSATFGEVIDATNDDWGCTQFIDLIGASHVKYYANTVSTSANYYGVTGTVYYNEDKEPLTDGVRLITSGSSAEYEWMTEAIPSGARYMRIGLGYHFNGSSTYHVIPFKLTTENIYGLQETVDEVDSKINSHEYNVLRNSRYSADNSTSATVSFLHFSDIHGDEGAAQAIKAYYDKYSSYISDMLSTGDVPYYYYADGIQFYIDNGLTAALLALGNHDGAAETGSNVQGSADWDAVGAQVDYAAYYAPYISGWNVTQPTDAATNYLMYYYKDYTSAGVRLIVLDVMHQTAEQLQWFIDTLADANTNGYTVIVASHYIPNTFTEQYIVKRSDNDKTTFHYQTSDSLTSIDTRFKLATTYADAVESFIANDGKFGVWLCGHYHTDYFTYSNTHPNILFCAINQAGYRRGGSQGYRVIGDHCANLVTIHPALGLIKIHRVGLSMDKFLRKIDVLTYDYINKKVITNY